jgi:hypothetical protein
MRGREETRSLKCERCSFTPLLPPSLVVGDHFALHNIQCQADTLQTPERIVGKRAQVRFKD